MQPERDLRSTLSKAKGLGAAHHGVGHWWLQRVTAVAIIPLSAWFVYSLVTTMLSPNVIRVAEWFSSPFSTILMVILLAATFIHAQLGMQVVIEDYVKGPVAKYALLMGNTFICYVFAALSILAVLKLHFLDVATSI
jgi:succinate dehydrogenase / fumarate reductase, membrane anchor subunit